MMGDKKDTCEDMVAFLMSQEKFAPILRKMKGTDVEISCSNCSDTGVEGRARAYLEINPTRIVLCKNRMKVSDTESLLSHEIVHAYDYVFGRCDMETCKGKLLLSY